MTAKTNVPVITIDVNGKGAALGNFYGVFFEDINHAADGGLYAQMARNPSFEFCQIDNPSYTPLTAWEAVGEAEVCVRDRGGLFPKNPHFAEIYVLRGRSGGIRNLGYGRGMYIKKGAEYKLSFFAKGALKIRVTLENRDGGVLSSAEVSLSDGWERYSVNLTAREGSEDAALGFHLREDGRIALDAVGLFPAETYKNGVYRKDLAEAIEELKPKFMRFPGGCLVHDGDLDPESRSSCYRWKNTIGAPEARPSRRNSWGYNQSLGIGYYEFFLLCEHFRCEPLPVLPAGWNPHRREACPMENMQPWIDDALDLIEFANGGADTKWGRVRCELGHTKPFRLKYLAIGNEEVGEQFPERYSVIAAAVSEKYPNIKLIHSAGPFPSGSEYERGYAAARRDGADLIDEHYYCSPEWLLANVHRYDSFPAKKPKVFLGEYASCGDRWYNALAEAAYMTGLENSAHAVSLACYAPLLCHVDYPNWRPNLIYFTGSRVCKTPSYYVQKLFSVNLGDYLLPVDRSQIKTEPAVKLPISGRMEIGSDGAEGQLRNVRLINLSDGDEVNFGSYDVAADFKTTLSEINLTSYELRFEFRKSGGRVDKGIYVSFGKRDDENTLFWQIGGWQNQDCLVSSRNQGLDACLDQHIFSIETGVDYDLCLRVDGRKITTFVNGEIMNVCEDKIPDIEDIYITASKTGKSGEIIIKAVNVREAEYSAAISLGSGSFAGKRYSLSGYEKTDTNTFEKELISPKETDISFSGRLNAEFPPLSVTVIRVERVK